MLSAKELAKYFDHTLLDPSANSAQIAALCEEAKSWGFYAVCVHPYFLDLCQRELMGSDVKLCTVVGFPLGQNTTATKTYETQDAIEKGAEEIDMVINYAALKEERMDFVKDDVAAVVTAAQGRPVKVIIETCLLNSQQKIQATHLCEAAGAQFVKTSTGFSIAGASIEDIEIIKNSRQSNIKIKASGGIRDLPTALRFIEAGADRLGASKSVEIVKSLK
ncbi:MAG: deoxyribose-phosphate aldolase [Bdellovibrionales bacterium]|nr:deoxyribose-phosphate aldolase [Bdellovibrionales bacterium]